MKEIQNKEILKHYLTRFNIPSLFDTQDLPFRMYEYQPGEMMNILHPTEEYLKFVVDGEFDLYTVMEDGSLYLLKHCKAFCFLGDLAFCGKQPSGRYQEVTKTVRTIELPLGPLKQTLDNDKRFLHYLLDTLADRLNYSTRVRTDFHDAEFSLLAHIRWRCPNQTLTSVENAAYQLNYSCRQLQRVLKKLTEQGTLERIGKGQYRLVDRNKPFLFLQASE